MKINTKLILTACALLGYLVPAAAQGTGSFLSQQSSKVKLMLAQILAYRTYLDLIDKAYHIRETGLNTARELKQGSLSLNAHYFNSLSQVSPPIQQNPKGEQMLAWQRQIDTLFSSELSWQQQHKLLLPAEMSTVEAVYTNLSARCRADIDALNQVLSPGRLQLSDRERLARIERLYASMQDKYAFAGAYTGHCRLLANVRAKAQQDRAQLKTWYGIH